MVETVVHFTDSIAFGGAEQALLHLLAGLDRKRWRPLLLYHDGAGVAPLLAGAHAANVETRAIPPMPMGVRGAIRMPSLAALLRQMRPAVFHAHLSWPLACKYGLVAAILARVPAIVATAQLYVTLPYTLSERWQQRLMANGVHRTIAVSQEVADRLHETFGIPRQQMEIVYNAIPFERFDRPANPLLRAELAGPGQHPVVLTVARLDDQKGHPTLLEAAAHLPDLRFVLAGAGNRRAALEAQAADLGIGDRVLFLGHRQDIPDLLASCDLFVLPSLYEGLPLSILEAMAAGKPVIGMAVGGTDEAVIHGETGLLVPPNDPLALAAAMRSLLDDGREGCGRALACQLAKAGKERVQHEFSCETMVERVMAIYEEILSSGRSAR
jgi:glycosyltransferase involved in cell wall biosynthesis